MKSYDYKSGAFIGKGGTEIFFHNWLVPNPDCILLILHGLGEHSGRYAHIIKELSGKKISIYSMDHRGHGKSGGKRGHIDSFDDYLYDIKLYINLINDENSERPLIILGHSLGGLIALQYSLTYPNDLKGLILSSSALMLSVKIPKWKEALGEMLSRYMPSFSMSSGLKAEDLSHDSYEVDAYENDPLVHNRVTTRFFTEVTTTRLEGLVRASELTMPLLVFHGDDDKIVDYKGSVEVFKKSSSKEKEIHILKGLYHETMNETENDRKKILQIVSNWIEKIGKPKKTSAKKKASSGTKKKTASKAKKSTGKTAKKTSKKK